MRVRMKATLSGTRNGAPWPARGEELDVPDEEGALLCANDLAEPVAQRGKPETRKVQP